MATTYTGLTTANLTADQLAIVDRVKLDLYANRDRAQVGIYGDSTVCKDYAGIPFRYAATRNGLQWDVCFDFHTGRTYTTAVFLPVDYWMHPAGEIAECYRA